MGVCMIFTVCSVDLVLRTFLKIFSQQCYLKCAIKIYLILHYLLLLSLSSSSSSELSTSFFRLESYKPAPLFSLDFWLQCRPVLNWPSNTNKNLYCTNIPQTSFLSSVSLLSLFSPVCLFWHNCLLVFFIISPSGIQLPTVINMQPLSVSFPFILSPTPCT